MNLDLILFRHGKAESGNAATEDLKRALTEEGKEELRKSMTHFRAFMKPNQEIHLWSSPLLRAVQTAEIISEEFGIAEILQFEFIGNGDYFDLNSELGLLKQPATVIIVGHDPYLSEWSKNIFGYQIPFKKGAAASFALRSLSPLAGDLECLISSEVPRPDPKKPLKEEYQKILTHCLSEVLKMKNLFLLRPEDPETAHQFRVKIRQIRSLISFIKPLLNQEDYGKVQDDLRNLANRFGYLREIDVLEEEWNTLIESRSDTFSDSTAFLSALKKERSNQQSQLQAQFGNSASSSVFNNLWVRLIEFPWENDSKKQILYAEFITARFKKWLSKARKELKKMEANDPKAIHSLRIRLKKLRYALTILEPALNKNNNRLVLNLKKLQDKLGIICDAQRDRIILKDLRLKYRKTSFHYESGVLEGYLISRAEQITKEIEKFGLDK